MLLHMQAGVHELQTSQGLSRVTESSFHVLDFIKLQIMPNREVYFFKKISYKFFVLFLR